MRPHLLLLAAAACSHAAVSPRSFIGDEAQPSPADSPSQAAAPELQRAAEAEIQRDDPESGVAAAAKLAKDHGGWVESMAAERVTVRVPDAQLDAVLAELPRLGELRARRVRAADVGNTHRDLQVRIDTLRRTRQRYLALLDKAQGIAEAIAVEHELERVTGQLERLEAELASLEKRIAYSGLSVDFSRELTPGPIGWLFYGAFTAVKKLFVWN